MAETLITDRRSASASYKILRRLGKGGMAEVFLARQDGMAGVRRLTVLKKLLPQFSQVPDIAEMLLDEARIAIQLTHPNIVQIYELGKDEGQYFIAMEFVDGCDVATLARIERHRQSRVPLRLALRVVSEAAMGLDYAHRQLGLDGRPLNIVHRDVSPHNIMCSREGAVKVTDFGIAKAVGKAQVTQVGVVKGKVQYMSPEQYTGSPVDHRSDIFSLGVVLYQLTVGRLPRVTESGDIVMRRVLEGKIPRPTEIRPDYPDELEGIVMRALAQNPDERYADAAALRDEVLDFARENDLLAFPKELGDYVSNLVPPTPLVIREQSELVVEPPAARAPSRSVAAGDRRGLPSVIVEGEERDTAAPAGTEVASPVGRRRGSQLVIADAHSDPFDQTAVSARAHPESGELDSVPAVLQDETFTPLPDTHRDPRPPRGGRQRQSEERSSSRARRTARGTAAPIAGERAAGAVSDNALVDRDDAATDRELSAEQATPTGQAAPRRRGPPAGAEPAARTGLHPAAWIVATTVVIAAAAAVVYALVLRPPVAAVTPPSDSTAKRERPRIGAGVINILSNPASAAVAVDGAQRCPSTPCQIAGLPLGRELLLTLRAPGHTLWMQRIVLSPGEPRLLLRADLAPETPPTAPGARPDAGASVGAAKKNPARKDAGKKSATVKKGGAQPKKDPAGPKPGKVVSQGKITVSDGEPGVALLAVDARPWAEVWVDGQKAGHTPLQIKLQPGGRKVELRNPELNFKKTYRVKAQLGKKSKITEILQQPGAPPS